MEELYAPKSNKKSCELRMAGNRFFSKQHYDKAIMFFNESISYAETDSNHLAIAYANRSAVYYKTGEYEFALANIKLAKEHNYPQCLMPKLLARELNCKANIRNGLSAWSKQSTTLMMNVDTNPKIPFLASGIRMRRTSDYRGNIEAEREFNVGDVILHEKSILTMLSGKQRYVNCNLCGADFHSLIPCTRCVSAMYCGEKCLENDYKSIHRFECGIIANIQGGEIGLKMFFYGLTLFGDNLSAMMKFCNADSKTTAINLNPLCLDYTNYNSLEEFKLIHNVDTSNDQYSNPINMSRLQRRLRDSYLIYVNHPYVKTIFNKPELREFMKTCMEKYQRISEYLSLIIFDKLTGCPLFYQFFPIATICKSSCNPNTAVLYSSGQLKFVARRPIAKNEQIIISHGLNFIHDCLFFTSDLRHFCNDCRGGPVKIPKVPIPVRHKLKLMGLLTQPNYLIAKVNALQQFIQLYSYIHPEEHFTQIQNLYQIYLDEIFRKDTINLLRAKAAESA